MPVQLSLDDARRPSGHGGWRPGAGRKPRKGACAHVARVRFPASVPLHVTLKVIGGLPSFRREAVARVVRAAIAAGGHRGDFRVVHYNVLGDHLHFVVEAAGAMALARGMQGLTIRLARRLNALLGRRGKLFAQRYHRAAAEVAVLALDRHACVADEAAAQLVGAGRRPAEILVDHELAGRDLRARARGDHGARGERQPSQAAHDRIKAGAHATLTRASRRRLRPDAGVYSLMR